MYGRYVRVTAVEVNKRMNIYEMEIHVLKIKYVNYYFHAIAALAVTGLCVTQST